MDRDYVWLKSYDASVPHHLDYPGLNIVELFQKRVNEYPQSTMLIDGNHHFSFRQVDELSNRIRDGLISMGCSMGDPIGLILPNNSQFVILFLGILKMGGMVVALNPTYQQREFSYHLIDSGAKIVFALSSLKGSLSGIRQQTGLKKVIFTDEDECLSLIETTTLRRKITQYENDWELSLTDLISIPGTPHSDIVISQDAPAILQYSGGTTGISKAAIGTHRNLVANVTQFAKWLSVMPDPSKPILGAIPLFHVYGMVLCMLLAIKMGVSLILVHSARDIEGIFEAIQKHKPGIFPCVPTLFYGLLHNRLLESYQQDLKSLQVCISGSAPLPITVKTEFEKLISGVLVEGYGLSEAPTATHCNPIKGMNKPGSIGLPLPDVICKIVSLENPMDEVALGSEGELLIYGPQVMAGYLNHDEENRTALQDGWLHTGDIAVMDEDGYFYIKGRKKDLIKVGGLQVWPQEIEEIISTHPSVKEVAVAGVQDEFSGERPVAWIVLKENSVLRIDELKQVCSESLAGYKQPLDYLIVSILPRTSVGKLLRRELIATYKK